MPGTPPAVLYCCLVDAIPVQHYSSWIKHAWIRFLYCLCLPGLLPYTAVRCAPGSQYRSGSFLCDLPVWFTGTASLHPHYTWFTGSRNYTAPPAPARTVLLYTHLFAAAITATRGFATGSAAGFVWFVLTFSTSGFTAAAPHLLVTVLSAAFSALTTFLFFHHTHHPVAAFTAVRCWLHALPRRRLSLRTFLPFWVAALRAPRHAVVPFAVLHLSFVLRFVRTGFCCRSTFCSSLAVYVL